ncbi:MAG TPA: pyroglutamyl-peptidase I [Chloroflexota bacterium]|jgi:pyroglutamyl-peptidase
MQAERRVLLTGFEPWANILENPALILAERLHGWRWGGLRVAALVLPVAHVAASARVAAALRDLRPSAVLHLGLAAGRPALTIERWAHNLLDFIEPDTAGAQPRQQPLRADGPPRLAATLDVDAAVRTLQAARVPAAASDDAGAYVCNAVLYGTLAWAAAEGYSGPVGFVHLPTAEAVSLADQERALRRLIRLLAQATTPPLAPDGPAGTPRAPGPAALPTG